MNHSGIHPARWNQGAEETILTPYAFYRYVAGRRFDPGAEAEAFQGRFGNPLLAAGGPGVSYQTFFKPIGPPPVYVKQAQVLSAPGAVEAGQIYGQPLQPQNI